MRRLGHELEPQHKGEGWHCLPEGATGLWLLYTALKCSLGALSYWVLVKALWGRDSLLTHLVKWKLRLWELKFTKSGDQSWVFFGRNDTKAETPVLWPPHAKSWLIGKDSDARRDWGQEEKGTTEGEMAGWHHGLDGHKSEWTPGVGDGQGGLECCNSWGRKALDTTERLNWTNWC